MEIRRGGIEEREAGDTACILNRVVKVGLNENDFGFSSGNVESLLKCFDQRTKEKLITSLPSFSPFFF